jgi:hypothetical protein
LGIKSRPLLYLRAGSVRHTEGSAFGLLLKTPCAADAYTEGLSKKEQKFGNSGTLAQEVQTGFIYQRGLLPTPNAAEAYNGAKTYNPQSQMGRSLSALAGSNLLPTPTAQDSKHSTTKSQSWEKRIEQKHLAETVLNPFIQPKGGKTSQLNPQFVAEMMGFPSDWTESPFQSGERKV